MAENFTKEQKDLLDLIINAIVSVLSSKNYPYMTPVWFVEHDGKIYFSTETTRVKGILLAKNKKIGISITHPKGGPYVSIVGNAAIRTKKEFHEYRNILKLILGRYVQESEQDKSFNDILENENRILVEIDPIKIINPKVVW